MKRQKQLTWLVRVGAASVFLLFLGCITCADGENDNSAASGVVKAETLNRAQLEKIIMEKLELYAAEFQDIDFVVLDSGGDVARNMSVLSQIIGDNAVPLDYAHPVEVRQQLLHVTLTRIQYLLQTEVGSSTLFRVGADGLASRQNVCIVTINPWVIAKDDHTATYYLLNIPDTIKDSIPAGRYLNHESHLRFTMDHEVFHCLNSLYNGPVPLSHQRHWGDYMVLKNEHGADAYGAIMHIADHGAITDYVRRLALVRGLTLLSDDPGHDTYVTLRAVQELDPEQLRKSDVRQRFQLATKIRNAAVGDYDDYIRYAIAADKTIGLFRGERQSKVYGYAEVDTARLNALQQQTAVCYRNLFGLDLPVTLNSSIK